MKTQNPTHYTELKSHKSKTGHVYMTLSRYLEYLYVTMYNNSITVTLLFFFMCTVWPICTPGNSTEEERSSHSESKLLECGVGVEGTVSMLPCGFCLGHSMRFFPQASLLSHTGAADEPASQPLQGSPLKTAVNAGLYSAGISLRGKHHTLHFNV